MTRASRASVGTQETVACKLHMLNIMPSALQCHMPAAVLLCPRIAHVLVIGVHAQLLHASKRVPHTRCCC
jgi:hypothetical protein